MNRKTSSFYWHDYETWGATPSVDRAAQFAGLRTDLDFNPLGEPLVIFARPADDFLPQPGACMVTGITPQQARDEGMPEADFFDAIHREMMVPGTCSLGYNTLRFDDEVSRYGFYRNLFDPYEREWKNGNSRWDMIDVVRLTRALRPDGIEWPTREDGASSFRLEDLTAANGIAHAGAHDALVDVHATIELARLVRSRQPRLFDYVLTHRDRQSVAGMLDVGRQQAVLHVSSRYPASQGCIAAVLPVAHHPRNDKAIAVFDLRHDPQALLTLSAEQIRARLYMRSEDLPEGEERIPLKLVHINKAPVVVPMNTLTPQAREEWGMDAAAEERHADVLRNAPGLAAKLAEVYADAGFEAQADPDLDLYGGFLSDGDRRHCEQLRRLSPGELAATTPVFEAPKLHEMLFRYRARNWPESLDSAEKARWEAYRRERIQQGAPGIGLQDYRRELSKLAVDLSLPADRRAVVDALIDWPAEIGL